MNTFDIKVTGFMSSNVEKNDREVRISNVEQNVGEVLMFNKMLERLGKFLC